MRGFTLIELAIVIVIAGILAAVAIPIYQSLVEDAKLSEGEACMGTIATAISTYAARYSWPDAVNDLTANDVGSDTVNAFNGETITVGGEDRTLPLVDFTGLDNWTFNVTVAGESFTITGVTSDVTGVTLTLTRGGAVQRVRS